MKDKELIEQFQSGSQEALEEIFRRYKNPMLNYALKMLTNRADAEDVVGEIFYILTCKKHMYSAQKAKFGSFLSELKEIT